VATSDRTVSALHAVAGAFRAAAEELVGLAARADVLAEELEGGSSLTEAMAAEKRPLIITRLTQLSDILHDAASEVRRAEASQLREEGLTHEGVAEVFGVSRQRVAVLLKPRPTNPRGPYRPTSG